MKTLTTKHMNKRNIFAILVISMIVPIGLTACSDDFPQPDKGIYCGNPKECSMPTGKVDLSDMQWDSFSEEEQEEIRKNTEALIGRSNTTEEPERVGQYSKWWHDEMRLQAEHASQEEHPFDLPEGWNWIYPGTNKAGPYNSDVYESFPQAIIGEYRVFEKSEKEAKDEMYQVYLNAEEIQRSDGEALKAEFKEMEIAGAKVYAAITPAVIQMPTQWDTSLVIFQNGKGHYFILFDRVDNLVPEMTKIISSLK